MYIPNQLISFVGNFLAILYFNLKIINIVKKSVDFEKVYYEIA